MFHKTNEIPALGNIFEYILLVKDFSVKYIGKYKD